MTKSLSESATVVGRLTGALGEFLRAWRRDRPASPRRARRAGPAFAALALCLSIGVVGYLFDADGVSWGRGLSQPTIHVFERITRLGQSDYVFALTVAAGALAVLARGRGFGARVDAGLTQLALRAMFLFDVAAVSGIASQVLKHLFGRARPRLYDTVGAFHFDVFAIHATYASFPSGHAVTAFAMATAILFLSPRWGWPLLALAALVGVSRVAIGAHYVSDVLAGAALGVASALLLRREFAARRLVFAETPRGLRPRGRGLIGRALVGLLRRSPAGAERAA